MLGVQAIANGAVPYIGPSAVQYGPRSELIHYLYLDKIGGFNVEAFRQSTVLIYWLAATIFFLTILLGVPTKVALLACLASVLVFPTLQMIAFQPDGSVDNQIKDTMEGVWGWPNAMRYVGSSVAMTFPGGHGTPEGARSCSPGRRSSPLGLTCFIAQENLAGGAIALVGGPARPQPDDRPRSLRDALVGVALGFAAPSPPSSATTPRMPTAGSSTSTWSPRRSRPVQRHSLVRRRGWGRMYYALPSSSSPSACSRSSSSTRSGWPGDGSRSACCSSRRWSRRAPPTSAPSPGRTRAT